MGRKGEKIGWIAGWLGGFSAVLALSIVWLAQGIVGWGVAGLLLFAVAAAAILRLSPWRFPQVRYWKLMAPIYVLFLGSVVLAIVAFDAVSYARTHWYTFAWILPCFTPLLTMGWRTWEREA